MLEGRRTSLRFDDFISDAIDIMNGIGQGDPLSMALYLYYNADLLTIPRGRRESAIAYVDDGLFIATGPTFDDTHGTLTDMMVRP
ncbi:hypothetical protein BV25DRAFT_1790987, partial [Artomyces pyxidatus]